VESAAINSLIIGVQNKRVLCSSRLIDFSSPSIRTVYELAVIPF
jgi:hypothetical protein